MIKKYLSHSLPSLLLEREADLSLEEIKSFIIFFDRFPKKYCDLSFEEQKQICLNMDGSIPFLHQEILMPERLEKRMKFLLDELESSLLEVIYKQNEEN